MWSKEMVNRDLLLRLRHAKWIPNEFLSYYNYVSFPPFISMKNVGPCKGTRAFLPINPLHQHEDGTCFGLVLYTYNVSINPFKFYMWTFFLALRLFPRKFATVVIPLPQHYACLIRNHIEKPLFWRVSNIIKRRRNSTAFEAMSHFFELPILPIQSSISYKICLQWDSNSSLYVTQTYVYIFSLK